MKVLGVVIAHPLRKTTGATNAAYELSQAIGNLMPYTLAMMWDKNDSLIDNGLTLLKFRSKNIFSPLIPALPNFTYIPFYSSEIPNHIKTGNYDLIHIHNPIPTFAMKNVAKACIKRGIPYCITSHGFVEMLDYAKIMKFDLAKKVLVDIAIKNPFKFVVKNAAWIFTLSPNEDEVLYKLNFPTERSSCVTNGVNKFFMDNPSPSELRDLQEKIGLIGDKNKKLLFFGSLYPYKGVDTFLASLDFIPYPVTAIVGGKLKKFQKETLLKSMKTSTLEKHRLVFTDWLTNIELRSLYHTCDIFVYPTRGDTLPLCILEAMACSRPIISTNVGGIPYQLDNSAGLIAKNHSPETIAKLVINLMENLELRKRLGSTARKRVEKVFNWESSAMSAIKYYHQIIELNKN